MSQFSDKHKNKDNFLVINTQNYLTILHITLYNCCLHVEECNLTSFARKSGAVGVEFEQDIIETTVRHIERLPFGTTSSMHSDFKAGRNTELDTLTRIVIELGRKHGISTPTYEMIYNQLKG